MSVGVASKTPSDRNRNVERSWAGVGKLGGAEADGLKGSMEFFAQCDVMLVQSGAVFRRPAAGADDAGQQRLDDLLAEEEVGAQGADGRRIDGVAT